MKLFFKGFKKGMKSFNESISAIINTILLFMVYIIGVGLTYAFAKIAGKHFLDLKKREDSYWSDLNLKKKEMKEYYRQF